MNWLYDPSRLLELLLKTSLIAAIAAVLLAPMTRRTHGNETDHAGVATLQQASSIEQVSPSTQPAF